VKRRAEPVKRREEPVKRRAAMKHNGTQRNATELTLNSEEESWNPPESAR